MKVMRIMLLIFILCLTIKKILYLDAPDLIVEIDHEPILSVEVSTEAGRS